MDNPEIIWSEIKNNWQIISSILTIVCIPIIKKLHSDFQNKHDKYRSNLKDLEEFYDEYHSDSNTKIKNKPRFFLDEQVRRFKEFNNLNWQFFIFLIQDKNLGYWDIVEINRNLSPAFTYLKIDGNQITYKDEKCKKAIDSPIWTKIKYIFYFLIGVIIALFIIIIIEKILFTIIFAISIALFELILFAYIDKLDSNVRLKNKFKDTGIWKE